jgi:hypothetical protein
MHPSHLAFSHLKRLVSIERGVTARGVIGSLKQCGQRLIGPGPIHTAEITHRPSSPISQKIFGTALPVVAVAAMWWSWCGAWTAADTLKSPATWPPWPRSRQRPARVEASSPDRAYKPYTRQLRLNPHAPLLAHKQGNRCPYGPAL